MIGLETQEFIQCPLCQRLIKLDLNDPEKAIRVSILRGYGQNFKTSL
jgi:hypothetical protein